MSFLPFILFIFAFHSAFAGSFTYLLKDMGDSKSFDFNKDGKADYIERYRFNVLIESHYDSDHDGKMDQHTFIDPEGEVFKIVDYDPTRKNPKKRISYWNHELSKKTIAFTEIDKNNDGKWDIAYESSTDIDQKKNDCPAVSATPVTNLASDVLAACQNTDDYIQTDFGYRIHRSCSDTPAKNWVLPSIRDAISQGLACLTRLSQSGMTGAAKNLSSLEALLSRNNVQIICNETSYKWDGVLAHATTGPEDAQRNLPLIHPGISLGPDFTSREQTGKDLLEFKKTVFHEQLHNLGHRHGTDPEVAYTCETCCFPGNDEKALTDMACLVCGSDYQGITDPQYLREITLFALKSYRSTEARKATLAFLRENNQSNFGFTYLAVNSGGVFGPVGVQLAEILSQKTDLTEEERNALGMPLLYKDYEPQRPFRESARVIAEAYLQLFQEQDPEKALKYLRENAPLIQRQLNSEGSENAKYMKENIREGLDTIISEVWYLGYRGRAPAVTIQPGKGGDALTSEGLALKDLFGL